MEGKKKGINCDVGVRRALIDKSGGRKAQLAPHFESFVATALCVFSFCPPHSPPLWLQHINSAAYLITFNRSLTCRQSGIKQGGAKGRPWQLRRTDWRWAALAMWNPPHRSVSHTHVQRSRGIT